MNAAQIALSFACASFGMFLYYWIKLWLAKRKRQRGEWKPRVQREVLGPTHSATIASDGFHWRIVAGHLPVGMVLNSKTGQIAWSADICSCCGNVRRARHEGWCRMCGVSYPRRNLLDLIESPEQVREYTEHISRLYNDGVKRVAATYGPKRNPWEVIDTSRLDSIGYASVLRDPGDFEIKMCIPTKKESGMKMTISTNTQLTKGGYVQVETALEMGGKVVDKDISVLDLRDDKHRKILEEAGWKAPTPRPAFYDLGWSFSEMERVSRIFSGADMPGRGGSGRGGSGMGYAFVSVVPPAELKFKIGDVVQFMPRGSKSRFLITDITRDADTTEVRYTYKHFGEPAFRLGGEQPLTRSYKTMEDGRFTKVGEYKQVKL